MRLYEQHVIRTCKSLDGIWAFTNETSGKEYQLPVPSCWEQNPDMLTYRGKGVYRKKIIVHKDSNLRFEFKGVSHTADVYYDDQFLAHHYNAFTGFVAMVIGAKKGEHTITVVVDNSFGEHSALHIPNDYYTYGGITRPVSMEEVADVYIERIQFTPIYTKGIWKANIEVYINNIGVKDQEIQLSAELNNYKYEVQKYKVQSGKETKIIWEQEFVDVQPWSIENPKLYLLSTQLMINGLVIDDLIERVGFRTISLEDNKLLLNGRPVFLKGINRHEEYSVVGCALSLQHMVHDLDLIKDMGANAIRTCHYPNDERFLDLCDERGILVWEESHARGLLLENMLNPNFQVQSKDCIQEMIEQHYNHPSIVIWGILNECASETVEGRKMYETQYAQIRSMDQSRPTTSATCRHFTDICLDLPDIVSFNMYSGWYEDVPVKERHDQEMEWIQSSGGAEKPVIVSEFGAAAIYGYRDRGHCKWSEERQADIIKENIEVYEKDTRLAGIFIWQFADCRVTEEGGWFATRARSHNNKGIVDEYRRPKMAYDVVKSMFRTME